MLELIRVLSHAHTPASVAQAAFLAVPSLVHLELGVDATQWIVTAGKPLEVRTGATPPFPFALTGAALSRSRLPQAIDARRAHASRLWCVGLGEEGHVALAFGPLDARAKIPNDAALALIAELLTSSLRHVDVVARVAELSRRAQHETTQLKQALAEALPADLVATSRAMRTVVHDLVPLVARQETTVLLRGETGTGKEVIARRIHAASRRSNRPFLKVNCGAIPEALVESALFGHERGAFTGATVRHIGIFERANGGTLLLDEVAELPPPAQVKLLRVLQDGDFERVGGERTIHVDVRVIAATHRPLEQLLAREAFRADLYYRLNVFPITLPPLRDRPEDLGPLVAMILARLSKQLGRAAPSLSPTALKRLQHHDWPGNIRELENILERALLLSRGDTLMVPDLQGPVASVTARPKPTERLDDALRETITFALAACDGRIFGPHGAAVRLGLKPTTLQSKMKRLGISKRKG